MGRFRLSGTERQKAALAAYKSNPYRPGKEIAAEVGISAAYYSQIIAKHEGDRQAQMQAKPGQGRRLETDRLRSFWPQASEVLQPFPGTEKERGEKRIRIGQAIDEMPQLPQERKMAYCKRIAAAAGCSFTSVHGVLQELKYAAIGQELRRNEALQNLFNDTLPAPDAKALGPVKDFTTWIDVFGKFRTVALWYENFAQGRGDVYASAFLKDIGDVCEKAQRRASASELG